MKHLSKHTTQSRPRVRPGPLALVFALASFGACHPPSSGVQVGGTLYPAPPPEDGAVVCGTVMDLSTNRPAEGVDVTAPAGRSARTDEEGRFEIRGMALGAFGELLAQSSDGRRAELTLLPLGRERREVVLYLPVR